MMLYNRDLIVVDELSEAIYACREEGNVFAVPEGRNATVRCLGTPSNYHIGSLDSLSSFVNDSNLMAACWLEEDWQSLIEKLDRLAEQDKHISPHAHRLLADAYLATDQSGTALRSYHTARQPSDTYSDGIVLLSMARIVYAQNKYDKANEYLQQITDPALTESAALLRRIFEPKTESADASSPSSVTTLHDFIKSVAADLDVQLARAIETISQSFMDRLGNLIGSDLALPEPQLLDVNNQPMMARQRVSLTYLATVALQAELIATGTATLDADSLTDLVARVTIERGHLNEEAAREFAVRYAALVIPNLDMLQQLK